MMKNDKRKLATMALCLAFCFCAVPAALADSPQDMPPLVDAPLAPDAPVDEEGFAPVVSLDEIALESALSNTAETAEPDRTLFTTPIDRYTPTEGFLLLIFCLLLVQLFCKIFSL